MNVLTATVLAVALAVAASPAAHADDAAQRNQWVSLAAPHDKRVSTAMVELDPDVRVQVLGNTKGAGRVMVIGGLAGSFIGNGGAATDSLSTAEIYDPQSNRWVAAAPCPVKVSDALSGVMQEDGNVIVAGGTRLDNDEAFDTPGAWADANLATEIYDPRHNTWSFGGSLPASAGYARRVSNSGDVNPHHSVAVPTGSSGRTRLLPIGDHRYLACGLRLFVNGGDPLDGIGDATTFGATAPTKSCLVLTYRSGNPTRSSWDFTRARDGSVQEMPVTCVGAAVVQLRNGKVMSAGGYCSSPATTSGHFGNFNQIYDPDASAWKLAAPMPAIPGEDDGVPADTAEPGARFFPHTALLHDGTVLVAGGQGDDPFGTTSLGGLRLSAVIYNPRTDSWSRTGDTNYIHPYEFIQTADLRGDGFLVTGWSLLPDFSAAVNGTELYDEASGTFAIVTTDYTPDRDDYASTFGLQLSTGAVDVIGGYSTVDDSGDNLASNDQFIGGLHKRSHGWCSGHSTDRDHALAHVRRLFDGRWR